MGVIMVVEALRGLMTRRPVGVAAPITKEEAPIPPDLDRGLINFVARDFCEITGWQPMDGIRVEYSPVGDVLRIKTGPDIHPPCARLSLGAWTGFVARQQIPLRTPTELELNNFRNHMMQNPVETSRKWDEAKEALRSRIGKSADILSDEYWR